MFKKEKSANNSKLLEDGAVLCMIFTARFT